MADNNNRISSSRIKKKKGRIKKRPFILLLLGIFLIGAGYAGYVYYTAYKAVDKSYVKVEGRETKSELREAPVYVSTDPFSVLLLGIEDYSDKYDKGRSDTIMVATFNPKQQTMKLLSIPRDTYVKIPGFKKDKINHAYAFGGKEETIKTVEQFLDIPIDYYATVNFKGFKNIVDLVGGVTVKVPFDFDDINSKWERFYFHEGKQKLEGEEALVYARMRMKDPRGDFGRNDRQRQIVSALLDELSSPKTLLKIDKIFGEIGSNVETNMKVSEALAFRKKYPSFDSSRMEQLQIEGTDDDSRGVYYFIPDQEKLEELKTGLKAHLDLLPDTAASDEDDNGSGSITREDKSTNKNVQQ